MIIGDHACRNNRQCYRRYKYIRVTPLYVIHKFDGIVPTGTQFQDRRIGDAQQLHRIPKNAAFHILAGNAIDIYLAIHALKSSRRIVIGKIGEGYLHGYKL